MKKFIIAAATAVTLGVAALAASPASAAVSSANPLAAAQTQPADLASAKTGSEFKVAWAAAGGVVGAVTAGTVGADGVVIAGVDITGCITAAVSRAKFGLRMVRFTAAFAAGKRV